jgi:ectoine hydroxylase-related dioxygenase (phytanoyl-CoA dioxygenase family)
MISLDEITLTKKSSSKHLMKLLNQFGVLVVKDFLDRKKTDNLLKDFENIYSSGANWAQITPYSKGRCCRVNRLEMAKKKFPTTSEIFGSVWMNEISYSYLGNESILNHDIFLVHDVPNSVHVAQDLHHDKIPTLKFFIYLTDTTTENGSFYCVPGSHKITKLIQETNRQQSIIPSIESTRDIPKDMIANQIPLEGKAGTLIIFDTDVFHRAGKVSSSERFVMRGHSRKNIFIPGFPKTTKDSLSKRFKKKIAFFFKSRN